MLYLKRYLKTRLACCFLVFSIAVSTYGTDIGWKVSGLDMLVMLGLVMTKSKDNCFDGTSQAWSGESRWNPSMGGGKDQSDFLVEPPVIQAYPVSGRRVQNDGVDNSQDMVSFRGLFRRLSRVLRTASRFLRRSFSRGSPDEGMLHDGMQLPSELVEMILLYLPPEDLENQLAANPNIFTLLTSQAFIVKYLSYHFPFGRSVPGWGTTINQRITRFREAAVTDTLGANAFYVPFLSLEDNSAYNGILPELYIRRGTMLDTVGVLPHIRHVPSLLDLDFPDVHLGGRGGEGAYFSTALLYHGQPILVIPEFVS